MKRFFLTSFILLSGLTSYASQEGFRYDTQKAKCLNQDGVEGLNQANAAAIFSYDPGSGPQSPAPTLSNKDLECIDLVNLKFAQILNTGARYVTLKNWNLKGAKFSGSDVSWMVFRQGTLEGADLTGGHMGYTIFHNVRVDANTKGLSENCAASEKNSAINCQR